MLSAVGQTASTRVSIPALGLDLVTAGLPCLLLRLYRVVLGGVIEGRHYEVQRVFGVVSSLHQGSLASVFAETHRHQYSQRSFVERNGCFFFLFARGEAVLIYLPSGNGYHLLLRLRRNQSAQAHSVQLAEVYIAVQLLGHPPVHREVGQLDDEVLREAPQVLPPLEQTLLVATVAPAFRRLLGVDESRLSRWYRSMQSESVAAYSMSSCLPVSP